MGRALVVDVLRGDLQPNEALQSPWYTGGFALVLADVEPLPFIPYKGSLGFFDVPDQLIAAASRSMIAG